MGWLLLLLVVLALAVFFVRKRKGDEQTGETESFPYVLGDVLFSPAERSFLGVLDQAVGADFRVFGKVRVADVVNVAKGTPKSLWQRAFNRISAKHFDYLLCRPTDLKPVCAIELNDQSHAKDERKGRDKFLEGVCASAGFPLVFLPARHAYTVTEICDQIAFAMGRVSIQKEPSEQRSEPSINEVANLRPQTEERGVNEGSAPQCPRCAAPMVRRIAKSGENAGKEFWGCTKFPACRGNVLS
jgi:ssDNA-binding Zn-finger/Zn-ribbon topoisomerase 1